MWSRTARAASGFPTNKSPQFRSTTRNPKKSIPSPMPPRLNNAAKLFQNNALHGSGSVVAFCFGRFGKDVAYRAVAQRAFYPDGDPAGFVHARNFDGTLAGFARLFYGGFYARTVVAFKIVGCNQRFAEWKTKINADANAVFIMFVFSICSYFICVIDLGLYSGKIYIRVNASVFLRAITAFSVSAEIPVMRSKIAASKFGSAKVACRSSISAD